MSEAVHKTNNGPMPSNGSSPAEQIDGMPRDDTGLRGPFLNARDRLALYASTLFGSKVDIDFTTRPFEILSQESSIQSATWKQQVFRQLLVGLGEVIDPEIEQLIDAETADYDQRLSPEQDKDILFLRQEEIRGIVFETIPRNSKIHQAYDGFDHFIYDKYDSIHILDCEQATSFGEFVIAKTVLAAGR